MDRVKSFFVQRLDLSDHNGLPDLGRTSDAGETVNDKTALSLSAVWGCTNLLAGTISSLPLMVYRGSGAGREIAKDHPLYRVLHDSPNYDQTAVDFWDFMAGAIELRGNAYAEKMRDGGLVTSLLPINSLVKAKRLKTGEIEYSWTEGKNARKATDKDVLHIRGFGGNPLGGMSTLEFARNSFGLARAVEKSASATFKNGMRPSGALTFADFLSPENREIAETRLAEKFIGAVNAGRPLILEGGTTWQSLTLAPEDAQMLESRKFSVEEICRFFGVPPHMIGHTESSTSWGKGLEQQTLGFQKFTLRRRLKRIEQALEKQLLTPADRAADVHIEFALEGLLRGDSAARSAFYASGLKNGWYTINEVRGLENLPPVAGGEVPRMQMQNVPITEAGNDNDV
jgi:HK97 family phage portal protein